MADRDAYDVGDIAVVTVLVRDPESRNRLIDSPVTVRALAPGATVPVEVGAARVDTGTYEAELPLTVPGTWQLEARTSGPYQAVRLGSLYVRKSNMP